MRSTTSSQEGAKSRLIRSKARWMTIWRETNVNTLTGGGVPVSRNAVMTLVAYTQTRTRRYARSKLLSR